MRESVHPTPPHLTVKDEGVKIEDDTLLCCQELKSQETIPASLVTVIQLLYPLEVKFQEPVSEECKENENAGTTGEPEDVPDDIGAPTPNSETADGSIELATSDAPRRSQRATAQRADANRMACMFELEDD